MKQNLYKNQNVIKFNIKPVIAILVCLVMVYTSCRKNDNAPLPIAKSTKAVSTDTLSLKVALNISKSLAGKFGGTNLMDGVDSISLAGHLGPHHDYNYNPLCGFFTDSLVSVDGTQGDTVSHTGGNLTFYFACQDGKSTGYVAYDSIGTTRTTPKGLFQNYYVKQAYTIKCLDDKHLFVGVNGDNYYYQLVNINCACTGTTYADIENSNYVLSNLTIDLCHHDILSGTATFKAYGIGWYITGTMTFLGNHMADMLINGKLYHVNLLTQTIVAA